MDYGRHSQERALEREKKRKNIEDKKYSTNHKITTNENKTQFEQQNRKEYRGEIFFKREEKQTNTMGRKVLASERE